MNIVHIIPNEKDPSTWTTKEVENVLDYLVEEFGQFPKNARIYHGAYAAVNDVTPSPTMADIERFKQLEGTFYVVIKPSLDPITIIAIVSAVLSVVSIAATLMMMPKAKGQQAQSPNNDLASRQNSARVKGRIPEIFGTVRSYPDLIAETYTYFNEDGVEVERSLLCIGNGYYSILDVKDAMTHVRDINGTSISIYDPSVDIRTTPIWRSGRTFTDLPLEVVKSKSITGQIIERPNDNVIESDKIYFEYPNLIKLKTGANIDFKKSFAVGDSLTIRDAVVGILDFSKSGNIQIDGSGIIVFSNDLNIADFDTYTYLKLSAALYEVTEEVPSLEPTTPESEPTTLKTTYYDLSGNYEIASITKSGTQYTVVLNNPLNKNPNWVLIDQVANITAGIELTNSTKSTILDGTYVIAALTTTQITLENPELVNNEWLELTALTSQSTIANNPLVQLDKVNNKWIGWYNVYLDNADGFLMNVRWSQGLYWQSNSGRRDPWNVDVLIEYQQVDTTGEPIGPILTDNLKFRDFSLKPFGRSKTIDFASKMNGFRFRVCSKVGTDSHTVSEMLLKDVYAFKRSTKAVYDCVTVIQSEAVANDGLYAIKERKLNALVQRKLPKDGTGALVATNRADQALIYAALNPFIGRRTISELNVEQIKAEIAAVEAYFGNSQAVEFCATLDDPKLRFEETVGLIASAAFCEATRFGNQLRLYFERPQTIAKLLFNHRNKVPKSEKRTYSTVIDNEYDGVEIEYTDPRDDARITYTLPENTPVTNPLKIDSTGIRNHAQAKTRAWREWNKLQYRRVDIEFEALDEANILVRNNMIMVADNTREKTQDGQVVKAEGLKLTLSQNVEFTGQASIYLQMPNGTVDVIGCRLGEFSNEVILNRMPIYPLVVSSDRYVKTVYQVVKASEKTQMFLLASAEHASAMTHKLTAYNYDARYYKDDHRFF